MQTLLEAIFEIVCFGLGIGLLFLLFGRRIKLDDKQKLPWWGFRKRPSGQIDMLPELAGLIGLIFVCAGFGLWFAFKALY